MPFRSGCTRTVYSKSANSLIRADRTYLQAFQRSPMKIAYLDSHRLYRVLYAGIQNLLREQDYLNQINVFPVPDGDTGTNMAFTLMGIVEGVQPEQHEELPILGRAVADAALDNARGNSGVILAQFFQGLSEGILDRMKLSTVQFAEAVDQAVKSAYTAMTDPREGTILTVLRRWGEHLLEHAPSNHDFVALLESSLQAARDALADTPNLLEVLKKAGVVDAAGHGFVSMLEGVHNFMLHGDLRDLPDQAHPLSVESGAVPVKDLSDLHFPFCTECIVIGEAIDREEMSARISILGDSLIIAGSRERAKIHIHTARPAELFEILENWGRVTNQKVDDMRKQQDSAAVSGGIALVVDSTCDLPAELMDAYHIHMVPVRVNFGDDQYIDKVTINSAEFYHKLQTDSRHPQTSQPPPGDFNRMYRFLASHHDSIISLHVPHASSGTLQNAERALDQIDLPRKKVIDSLSLSIGEGLIALELAEAIAAGADYETVVALAEATIPQVKIFVHVETLDAALRGGRVSLRKKNLIDLLRLNPILTMNPNGKVGVDGVTRGHTDKLTKFLNYCEKQVRKRGIKRIGIAHADNPAGAKETLARCQTAFPTAEIYQTEVCPALGAHAGHHAIGLAFQFED